MLELAHVLQIGAFCLGVILGSFLNALVFRFNTGRGFFRSMNGRSRCMHCRHTLGALDLIPLFSYLALGGRCRYCRARVSVQYPLVELCAGVLSLLLWIQFSSNIFLYTLWLLVWLIILFIVVYDVRHMIIPWSASLTLLVFALLLLVVGERYDMWSLIAGPALALPLFLISLVSHGKWMGWADSLFELSLGWLLGFTVGLTGLMLAIWSGALVGIGIMWVSKRATITMKSEIPFAPFLALGAALAFFFHVDFFPTLPYLFL